jgi:ATP-binding protein involved in chromosome partitioning
MSQTRESILQALSGLTLPDGGDVVSRDLVRALNVQGDRVSFILEAETPRDARQTDGAGAPGLRATSEENAGRGAGDGRADRPWPRREGPAEQPAPPAATPPNLQIGGHMKPQQGSMKPSGVRHIIGIGSGKGGVGKSTVASNLAVALARAGRRVGLLDADIYGPSQPRMMGVNKRPSSPDGKTIIPLKAHGVTCMSIGFMLPEEKAVVWRGPMLMGALQQMLTQVEWGELDVLLVDLPPGTGDVAMTLCQKSEVTGAIVVSTPQDVALLDARKALNMFELLKTPVLGMIENMASYSAPIAGTRRISSARAGSGGGRAHRRAVPRRAPRSAWRPGSRAMRGTPIAAGDGPMAEAYAALAQRFIAAGWPEDQPSGRPPRAQHGVIRPRTFPPLKSGCPARDPPIAALREPDFFGTFYHIWGKPLPSAPDKHPRATSWGCDRGSHHWQGGRGLDR